MRYRAVIEVRAVFLDTADQESRFWFLDDKMPTLEPQDWMVKPRKTWAKPQEPVVFSFLVKPENRMDALRWLESLMGSKESQR